MGCHFLLQGIFPTQGSNPGPCITGRHFTLWVTRKDAPRLLIELACCNYWSLCLKPMLGNKPFSTRPSIITNSSPSLPQLEKSPSSNEDLVQPKVNSNKKRRQLYNRTGGCKGYPREGAGPLSLNCSKMRGRMFLCQRPSQRGNKRFEALSLQCGPLPAFCSHVLVWERVLWEIHSLEPPPPGYLKAWPLGVGDAARKEG